MDQKPQVLCCQWADDEQLQNEPDLFQCETCPVAEHLEGLDAANAQAWTIFQQLATRLVVDAKLGPEVFRRMTEDVEEIEPLLTRLGILYDVMMPPKAEQA